MDRGHMLSVFFIAFFRKKTVGIFDKRFQYNTVRKDEPHLSEHRVNEFYRLN